MNPPITNTKECLTLNNGSTMQILDLGGETSQSSVFVCTFCQVFALSDVAIIDHINTVHTSSLPAEIPASRFVSKLQALPDKAPTTIKKKVGRPRKILKKCDPIPEDQPIVPEPIPSSDGLYWCTKCDRHFKKSRQLTNHVCCEEDNELASSSDSETNCAEYKTHMDVDPRPWSRKCLKNKPNHQNAPETNDDTLQENQQQKVKSNWRTDPNYIPLFQNEAEKIAFEKHLNSIDYSIIDDLFTAGKRKVKSNKETGNAYKWATSYTCIVCQRKIPSLTHIRMHCLTHTDLNLFTCPKCPYSTNTKGSLYSHMRNHTGNVFQCPKCSFQTVKRSHLVDHEETHSTVPQICKLCKNSYKTVRSLIAHVKRYHNNPGGKKYAKSFLPKQLKETYFKCSVCQKRFKSQSNLDAHKKKDHNESAVLVEDLTNPVSNPEETFSKDVTIVEDPLAEIVLNDLLHQKDPEPIELYDDVFEQSQIMPAVVNVETTISPQGNNLSQTNIFDKNLNLGILEDCIQNSNFVEEVMNEALLDPVKLGNRSFGMGSDQLLNASMNLVYPDNQMMSQNIIDEANDVQNDVNKADATSAENELFKQCKRAPAYVCCVCSSIYINPVTLKAHLKEHVNSSCNLIETVEPTTSETDAAIDSMCSILQDETHDASVDKEKKLEMLFSSSLDMMYYLPEVKVVLENDPSIFDALWDDISNFSITEKYEDSEELRVKSPDLFQ